MLGGDGNELCGYFYPIEKFHPGIFTSPRYKEFIEFMKELNIRYERIEFCPLESISHLFYIIFKEMAPIDEYKSYRLRSLLSLSCPSSRFHIRTVNSWLKYFTRVDIKDKNCLLIVDMQVDFLTGSLKCNNDFSAAVDKINSLIRNHNQYFDLIIYSQDWHPQNHISFKNNIHLYNETGENKVPASNVLLRNLGKDGKRNIYTVRLFDPHCIENTPGAELYEDLIYDPKKYPQSRIVKKGTNSCIECFSMFYDNLKHDKLDTLDMLLNEGITRVYVCGVAMEFCVRQTALDSYITGFPTFVLLDAIIPYDENNTEDFIIDMKNSKISVCTTDDFKVKYSIH